MKKGEVFVLRPARRGALNSAARSIKTKIQTDSLPVRPRGVAFFAKIVTTRTNPIDYGSPIGSNGLHEVIGFSDVGAKVLSGDGGDESRGEVDGRHLDRPIDARKIARRRATIQ